MERAQLLHYAIRYQGDYSKIQHALAIHEPYDAGFSVSNAVTLVDEVYPQRLRELPEPPYVVFWTGNWNLINEPGVAIVGSRNVCPYAKRMTQWIASYLSKRYVIISGLAKGADATAHEAALINGRSIAVLGCGIDRIYPKENSDIYTLMRSKGLIISEYPGDTLPLKHHFPWRNRIVSALAHCVVVTQADFKSGSMITVRHALAMGKEVATIPYQIGEPEGEACNALIQDGAQILLIEADLDLI